MMRRTRIVVLAVAVVAAGLTIGSAPAGAAGSITPWSTSVAVGGTFSATANGCPSTDGETDTGYWYQQAELVLVTGTGATERLASFGQYVDSNRIRFKVPGWVDPDQSAVVAGRCVRTTYDYETPGPATTTVSTFGDAAIDITPGTAIPTGPVFTLNRTSAAGGQVVVISGSGCEGSYWVNAALLEGDDLSGRTLGSFVSYGGQQIGPDGTFSFDLALNQTRYEDEDGEGISGPVAEGTYTVLVVCGEDDEAGVAVVGEPQLVTVAGSFPSDQIVAALVDDQVKVTGSACIPGATVTVRFDGYGDSIEFAEGRRNALAKRSLDAIANLVLGEDGAILETIATTADSDGNWMVTSPSPDVSFGVQITADCGDPTADGFRYVDRYVNESNMADVYISRASPTSSPTGGLVAAQVQGFCDGDASVALLDGDRNVVATSGPFMLDEAMFESGSLTAPATAGRYELVGRCDEKLSYGEPYEVFTPEQVSGEAPLAPDASSAWPSKGPREVYEGRIGPITLPAMPTDMEAMGASVSDRAMGPSGLFIPVPRPDGDFAITKLTFNLVDADGMPVEQDMAHLHHFVITNKKSKNPACPNGTFGLPGEIVGAAGAERTVLSTGDPYGLVVKDSDDWTGVYELMSRSDHAQEVYLSYDITYRRDVNNVRPVRTYFGSATGCNSFTWTVDGSGTPDTQSHFITVAKDARLIGGGGHIHSGGMHSTYTNDRGRELCRSELQLGDTPMHPMTHMRSSTSPDDVTATTMVEPTDPESMYPPEFYPDDKEILGITGCPMAEALHAGERLRFDAVYENDRPRSGVMGIFTFYVWEGGGPAQPGPGEPAPPPAIPVVAAPNYTG